MDDYISRQVILKHLEKCKGQPPEMCYTFAVIQAIESFVKDSPAADVLEVVRCKECILHEDFPHSVNLYCNRVDAVVKPDGFCKYGKKYLEEST